jgi:hypothetical protein
MDFAKVVVLDIFCKTVNVFFVMLVALPVLIVLFALHVQLHIIMQLMLIMERAHHVQLVVQLVLLLLSVRLVYRDTDYSVQHVLHVVLIVYNVLTQLVQAVQPAMPL